MEDLALGSHSSEMLSSGLDNLENKLVIVPKIGISYISGLQRDNSTIRMSHKAGDEIGVREGVGGGVKKLGISLGISRPLAIHVGVSSVVTIALRGQVSGGGGKVVVVGGDNSAVSVGDQLGVSLGGSLTVHVGVSIGVVTIALGGKMGGCGGGISGVIRGDGAIRVVDKLTGGHGH